MSNHETYILAREMAISSPMTLQQTLSLLGREDIWKLIKAEFNESLF